VEQTDFPVSQHYINPAKRVGLIQSAHLLIKYTFLYMKCTYTICQYTRYWKKIISTCNLFSLWYGWKCVDLVINNNHSLTGSINIEYYNLFVSIRYFVQKHYHYRYFFHNSQQFVSTVHILNTNWLCNMEVFFSFDLFMVNIPQGKQ
jgi:hypothetical protein